MQGRSFFKRTLAGVLAIVSVALFAAPANAAAGTWNASNTTAGEASAYSYSGVTTQDASLQSVKATVPMGTSSSGAKAVQFNSRGGVSTPTASGQASNSMELIFRIRMDDWTPSTNQSLASKWTNTNGERAWALQVNTDGTITWRIGNTASGVYNLTTPTALGFADGSTQWLRVAYYISVPSDNRYLSAYQSADGTNWGSAIASVSQSNARTVITNSSAPLRIGHGDTSIGTVSMRGAIYSIRITDNNAAAVIASYDAADYATGTATWDSGGSTWTLVNSAAVNGTVVGADLTVSSVTGVAAGGRAYLMSGANEIYYQHSPDAVVVAGTAIAVSVSGLFNTATPGTYSSSVTTNTQTAVVDTFNMNSNAFISPTGVPFAVDLAPLFSFTVAPRASECSLQIGLAAATYVSPGSATASNLGQLNPSTIRSTAYDLSVATNARSGAVVNVRGAQASNNMRSATQQPFADSIATPVVSASTFSYTVGNTHNSLNTSWKALSDASAEVAFSSALGFTNQCVGQTLAVSQTTPPGAYSATVVYTAVPTF